MFHNITCSYEQMLYMRWYSLINVELVNYCSIRVNETFQDLKCRATLHQPIAGLQQPCILYLSYCISSIWVFCPKTVCMSVYCPLVSSEGWYEAMLTSNHPAEWWQTICSALLAMVLTNRCISVGLWVVSISCFPRERTHAVKRKSYHGDKRPGVVPCGSSSRVCDRWAARFRLKLTDGCPFLHQAKAQESFNH